MFIDLNGASFFFGLALGAACGMAGILYERRKTPPPNASLLNGFTLPKLGDDPKGLALSLFLLKAIDRQKLLEEAGYPDALEISKRMADTAPSVPFPGTGGLGGMFGQR